MTWTLDCFLTAQKMEFSIKDFLSKCDQIRRKLQIWSHLLKKSLNGKLRFCPVSFFCTIFKNYVHFSGSAEILVARRVPKYFPLFQNFWQNSLLYIMEKSLRSIFLLL